MAIKQPGGTAKLNKMHGDTKKASKATGRSKTGKGVRKPGF